MLRGWQLHACAAAVLLLAALAAYHGTFHAPFFFDDEASILTNPSLHSLWSAWSPPSDTGTTVVGRPLLNFSFAVNRAISGTGPWSYHVVNLAIHATAGILVFDLIRRTLLGPVLAPGMGAGAFGFALLCAALWTLHPLQTESVTYVVQRAESLMGFWCLLTFWCFARACAPGACRAWAGAAVAACLAGMATKEVMVVTPVLILLYDRTFFSGSFRAAWQARRGLHVALAATWLLLAWLVKGAGNRGGTFSLADPGGWWSYHLTQCIAIVRYLRLVVWPEGLCVDYGTFWIEDPVTILPHALLIAALVAATVLALWRRPCLGFLGAAFFALLAPSSLPPGAIQMIVEHRMYLALLPVLILLVAAVNACSPRLAAYGAGAAAIGFGLLTARRNLDYASVESIWADTVRKAPGNFRAHNNLGAALAHVPGQTARAIACFREAVRLQPAYPDYHCNLAHELARLPGSAPRALVHYQLALRLAPGDANALLGVARLRAAAPDGGASAIELQAEAVRLHPHHVMARLDLANSLSRQPGREAEAVPHYEAALRLDPGNSMAHNNLASLLGRLPGRAAEAGMHYERAIRLAPSDWVVRYNYANLLARQPGGRDDAIRWYRDALRLRPGFFEAHLNLAGVLAETPSTAPDAIRHYEQALVQRPDFLPARHRLAALYADVGRRADAIRQLEEILAVDPQSPAAREAFERLGGGRRE